MQRFTLLDNEHKPTEEEAERGMRVLTKLMTDAVQNLKA
jgi:hypothetical protein